jgi:hypothetical protein
MLESFGLVKNAHAVALGKLGGSKGGKARAHALTALRRQEIASAAGRARARSLSSTRRQEIARLAVRARWSKRSPVVTGADTPAEVRRLLKTYDPEQLRWTVADDRYAIVREILVRGDARARRWLNRMLEPSELRELVRGYRGAGCNEPERVKLRKSLGLSVKDIPVRPYVGLQWRGPT